jgi:signal transduction histidine kinase
MSVDEKYLQAVMRTLSHDLGGAIRAASGFSQLMLDEYSDRLDEKALYWLSLIKDEGVKAQTQLAAFSQYARLYGVSDGLIECDLAGLCKQMMQEPAYLSLLKQPSQISVLISPLVVVSGYEHLWSRYFLEILSNSVKYASVSGREVICRVFIQDHTDGYFSLIIEDDGAGLSTKAKTDLAALPYRTVADNSGVGMGLSMAKRIVELHGGEFSLDSVSAGVSAQATGLRVVAKLPKTKTMT